jgi:hypothetical protein
VHGYAKQGARFGFSRVRGLNALLATVITARAAPVDRGAATVKGLLWIRARREAAVRRRTQGRGHPADRAEGRETSGADGLGVLRPAHDRCGDPRQRRCPGHRPMRSHRQCRHRGPELAQFNGLGGHGWPREESVSSRRMGGAAAIVPPPWRWAREWS